MNRRRWGLAGCLVAVPLLAGAAPAQDASGQAAPAAAPAAAEPQTRTIVAGPEFDRSGTWRFWFGQGFRQAWTTPVQVPVLDLAREAGGLTPLRQVGGLQTVGLALRSGDGRGFTFRKLEKHPERVLPKEWQESALRSVAFDQTAAAHPAATVVVGALAQSVGLLFYGSRLVVMPDDPALGEFRQTFANSIGTLDEYPGPGYKGITEIVSTPGLWKKWLEGGPQNRVDSRAFLKARLFDLAVGNWDRHYGQWRWARVAGQPLWEPVPEDADQAFTRYEGRAMAAVRRVMPRFMRYDGRYPKKLEGLTANNADVTRWLLADVEWPVYEEVARELQAQMTDAVIDEAMRRMPPEWYAIDGAQMTRDLRQRRDGLLAYARKFYRHLADRVDVRGSDQDELASLRHLDDGGLELTLAPLGADGAAGAPTYQRRFSSKETQEIRLYLLGGNDRLVSSGPRRGGIELRVMGGPGNDQLGELGGGQPDWQNPAPDAQRPWMEPRNYGSWTVPMIQVYWEPNQEFMLGGGWTRTAWGFRKYPWSTQQSFTLLYSTGYQNVRASYGGRRRLSDTSLLFSLDARFSGIENRNYFGFGNETPEIDDKALYKTETNEFRAFPALRWQPGPAFELYAGVDVKGIKTKGGDSLVEQEQPYGAGDFGEALVRAGFEYDSRGRSLGITAQRVMAAPETSATSPQKVSGVRLLADGFYAPKTWDVASEFGGVEGSLSGYLGGQRLVLATRVGGRAVWGDYPWFESASIGDGVRGYYEGRFRGDSALYGNAELRWWVGSRKRGVLPLRWGLTAFAESGRVWLEGEDSDKWHNGFGGGLVAQLIGTPMALGASIAQGSEGVRFYFSGGFSF